MSLWATCCRLQVCVKFPRMGDIHNLMSCDQYAYANAAIAYWTSDLHMTMSWRTYVQACTVYHNLPFVNTFTISVNKKSCVPINQFNTMFNKFNNDN